MVNKYYISASNWGRIYRESPETLVYWALLKETYSKGHYFSNSFQGIKNDILTVTGEKVSINTIRTHIVILEKYELIKVDKKNNLKYFKKQPRFKDKIIYTNKKGKICERKIKYFVIEWKGSIKLQKHYNRTYLEFIKLKRLEKYNFITNANVALCIKAQRNQNFDSKSELAWYKKQFKKQTPDQSTQRLINNLPYNFITNSTLGKLVGKSSRTISSRKKIYSKNGLKITPMFVELGKDSYALRKSTIDTFNRPAMAKNGLLYLQIPSRFSFNDSPVSIKSIEESVGIEQKPHVTSLSLANLRERRKLYMQEVPFEERKRIRERKKLAKAEMLKVNPDFNKNDIFSFQDQFNQNYYKVDLSLSNKSFDKEAIKKISLTKVKSFNTIKQKELYKKKFLLAQA